MSGPSKLPPISPEYQAEYQGDALVAVSITFIVLETIFLCLRFISRRLAKTPFGLDDWLMPFAWIVNIGLCITCLQSVYNAGVGRHLLAVLHTNPLKVQAWAKTLYAVDVLYLTSAALPKLSIILLYLRIFTSSWQRKTCYVLLAVVIVNWAVYVIAASLQCTPFAYQWDKTIPGGHCYDIEAYYKTTSVPNIATDLVILVLPLPLVWNLQTGLLRKISLTIVFLLGSMGIVSACVRMATFFLHDAFIDNTWESVPLMAWTLVEPGTYFIAACMLAMRPLLRAVHMPQWMTQFASKQYNSTERSTQKGARARDAAGRLSKGGFIELRTSQQQPGVAQSEGLWEDPHSALNGDYSSHSSRTKQSLVEVV